MSISHTPTPARSDVPSVRLDPADSAGSATQPFLTHGRVLTAGAVAWSASILGFGLNNTGDVALLLSGVAAGVFQVGLLFLLRVLWRTQALGRGKLARAVLRFEAVLVSLAIGSTVADAIQISDLGQLGWGLLDACWPLSMLGMFFIGVRIAVAGRWKGASRFWPMVAESWAVVTVPTLGIFGEGAATVVGGLHLLVGYAVLGVLVSRKQQ